jgi:pantothenate kinase type III
MNMVANQGGIISPGLTLWLADLRGRAASLLMVALIALCGGVLWVKRLNRKRSGWSKSESHCLQLGQFLGFLVRHDRATRFDVLRRSARYAAGVSAT